MEIPLSLSLSLCLSDEDDDRHGATTSFSNGGDAERGGVLIIIIFVQTPKRMVGCVRLTLRPWVRPSEGSTSSSIVVIPISNDESCQEFGGWTVLQIEAVHNLRKVHMYLNVLSLQSTS